MTQAMLQLQRTFDFRHRLRNVCLRIGHRRVEIQGAMKTHTGLVREHNEDTVSYGYLNHSCFPRTDRFFALVADGMGGHVHGEMASRIAAESVRTCLAESRQRPTQALSAAFDSANQTIRALGRENANLLGMGTTCTAIAVDRGLAFLAHAGDSRAYHWRDGDLLQLSCDHSVVSELLRNDLITPDEAATHPHRHIILKAIGLEDEIHPDIWETGFRIYAGDIFCLCTDGLSNHVDLSDVSQIISTREPQDACTDLLEIALAAGGEDNVSVGVFRVVSPDRNVGNTDRRSPVTRTNFKVVEP